VGAQVRDVTLAARRPSTNDILDGARIEDATLHDSSSNDRGGHQIDSHHRIRPVRLGASAAAPHDSGQVAGVQEHRGKRKGHEDGSGVQQGDGKRVKGDKDTTKSGTSESGKRANTGSEGHQGGEQQGMADSTDGQNVVDAGGSEPGTHKRRRSKGNKNSRGKHQRLGPKVGRDQWQPRVMCKFWAVSTAWKGDRDGKGGMSRGYMRG
jgi:hypothetical protein